MFDELLDKMFDELNNKGIVPDKKKQQNIFSPVGLNIGAETSEEIVLSVIAEIKAVLLQRLGASLKQRTAAIHNRALISQHE